MNQEAFDLFCYWIREREAIRLRRDFGAPAPWTQDPILRARHFCNVRREDDRVTKELREVVRCAGWGVRALPYAYTLARLFNRAATLRIALAAAPNWVPAVKKLRAQGSLVFHTAYVVSTCGQSMDKIEYVDGVANAVGLLDLPTDSLAKAFNKLRTVDGLGSFLAGQIIADLKNDRYLEGASDWSLWSCMGPGSKKGLQYIFETTINEKNYAGTMWKLQQSLPDDILAMNLHAQDLQNCLCEFSKYHRYFHGMAGRIRNFEPRD